MGWFMGDSRLERIPFWEATNRPWRRLLLIYDWMRVSYDF